MAPPDLNTLPQSSPNSSSPTLPQRTTQSRRASNMMTGRPSQSDEGDVPIRHPRPLTTAELHLEMEQEQEAAVNTPPTIPPTQTQHTNSKVGQPPRPRALRSPSPALRLHSVKRILFSNQRHRPPNPNPAPTPARTRPNDTAPPSLPLLSQYPRPAQHASRHHSSRFTSLRRPRPRRSRHAFTGKLTRKRYRHWGWRGDNAGISISASERESEPEFTRPGSAYSAGLDCGRRDKAEARE